MKISKDDIIRENLELFRGIVPDIRNGDDLALVAKRVGSRLTVVPNNQDEKTITITLKLDSVIAVSKGADFGEIVGLLEEHVPAALAALGTDLGTRMTAISSIGGASADLLKHIMSRANAQNNTQIKIPVTNLKTTDSEKAKIEKKAKNKEEAEKLAQGDTEDKVKVQLSVDLNGWTVTTDTNASEEKANVWYQGKLPNKPTARKETKNEGLEAQKDIRHPPALAVDELKSDSFLALLDIGWNLTTNGAGTHDTVSIVQIANATIVLSEV